MLQYSGLENPVDLCIVHGVSKSQTRLSDFHKVIIKHRLCALCCVASPCSLCTFYGAACTRGHTLLQVCCIL